VTVEHEPDTRSEDAVKGTDTAGTGTSADIEPAEAATGESSTETGVDADETGTEVDTTETDAESAGDTTGQSTDTDADTDTTSQSADTDAETGTTGPSADPDTDTEVPAADLEELKGIGPAYAGRLREAGIEDVAALAAADAADLAERTDIAEGRLQTFVERAAEK
jgi:predicted flap endonuclease-1-like 5' DNA nuclease